MSKISAIEEETKAATVGKQAELATAITNICQQLAIPNREIIELVFREYLKLPRDFIDIAKLATSIQQAVGAPGTDQGGGGMPGGMPPMGGGLGGGVDGGMGAELGLEPPQGTPPEVEFTDQPNDAAPVPPPPVQDSHIRYRANAVRLFESHIRGKRDLIMEHLDTIQSAVRNLQDLAITGKVSLMDTEDQSPWRNADPLPAIESDRLNESKSVTEMTNVYSDATLLENKHLVVVGTPLEVQEEKFAISGAVKVGNATATSMANIHEAAQHVAKVRKQRIKG